MKKLLFMIPSLKLAGMERVFVTYANMLVHAGYDVTAIAFDASDDLKQELDKRVKFIYKPPKNHFGRSIPYIRHKFYDVGLWETRASARQLYDYYVGKEKYDVEIAFYRGRCVKIISGSTNPDSLKIAWVHNDFSMCKGITSSFSDLNGAIKAYDRFDKIICVSKMVEKSFQKVIGITDKTMVMYNPIPVDEIKEKSHMPCDYKKQRFTIMSIGRLMPAKGYDRLIKACARLQKEGHNLGLIIIGYGSELDNLKTIANSVEIKNLTFTGKQENPFKFIKSADLYVCSSRYEGYNLTVAEALSLGIPVLTTNCAGPPEILENGKYGMIVENSERGLYHEIRKLLKTPELLAMYKEKAAEAARNMDEKHFLHRLKNALD